MRYHPPLGGAELAAAVRATPAIRPYLIENLVLHQTTMLMVAPYGRGKTTVLISMVVPGTSGLPVFGHLKCARPLRFYIFCPERSALEIYERLRKAEDLGYPVNWNNLYIDDGMTGVTDFCDISETFGDICSGVKDAMNGHFRGEPPDIICVEGLYAMSARPMVDPAFARGLMAFNTRIFRTFGASIWYSSHAKKQQRDYKGNLIDIDALGGVLIMANVTGFYLFDRLDAPFKSHMVQKKDTVSGLANELVFTYNPESGLLELDATSAQVTAKEKFRIYLNSCLASGNTFTVSDLMHISGTSQSTVNREIAERVRARQIENVVGPGKPGVYRVVTPV